MRALWTEQRKFQIWLQIELLASEALVEEGVVPQADFIKLKSGVDLSTIANWLGHASVNTTNKYASMDLEMKRRVLEKARPLTEETPEHGRWHRDPDILAWLESL